MSKPGTSVVDRFGIRLLGAVLWRLGRLGIRIYPFLVVREGLLPRAMATDPEGGLSAGFVGPETLPELARLDPRFFDEATLAERMRTGKLCYAVRAGERMVAKMWCDLEEFSHEPVRRRLGPREVYLFDAYTDPSCRGRDLAPLMRQGCYEALRKMGRDVFYSATDFVNTPARRFKAKLGAREESLHVHVSLFGRWSHTFSFRNRALREPTAATGE